MEIQLPFEQTFSWGKFPLMFHGSERTKSNLAGNNNWLSVVVETVCQVGSPRHWQVSKWW